MVHLHTFKIVALGKQHLQTCWSLLYQKILYENQASIQLLPQQNIQCKLRDTDLQYVPNTSYLLYFLSVSQIHYTESITELWTILITYSNDRLY